MKSGLVVIYSKNWFEWLLEAACPNLTAPGYVL
jgi:hypothetical protein